MRILLFMHIVACQLDIAWENSAGNRERVRAARDTQTVPTGSLIVLPEMFETGFTMNVDAACDSDGSSGRFLSDLSRSYQSTVIAGVVTKDAEGKGLNQAAVFGPDGGEVTRYTTTPPSTTAGEAGHSRAGGAGASG